MAKYVLLVLTGILLACMPAYSQEEDVEYGYGTVLEIKKDSNEIVVSEYDWENDEESEISYSIRPNAIAENIDSWKNIAEGTYIDIEYVTDENGKRIISYISVYEAETQESEAETQESEME